MVRSTETVQRRTTDGGARALDPGARRGRRIAPIAIAAVVALLLVAALVAVLRGGSDEGAATGSAPQPTALDPFRPAVAEDGSIVAEGATLLPLSPAVDSASGAEGATDGPTLAAFSGMQAAGTRVAVQSVPAEGGFWAGTAKDDRVWVQLTGPRGDSPPRLRAGDVVSFTGVVTDLPDGFARRAGITAAEGSALLEAEGQYLAVPRAKLTVHR